MTPGDRIRTARLMRSQRTGLILPREGTVVSLRENLGRTLVLVDFGEAGREYVLSHEIELERSGAINDAGSETGP